MSQRFIVLVAILLTASATLTRADQPPMLTESQRTFFETKIRPVLVEHCYACHAAEAKSIKGGLRLDHRAGLLKGGDSGPAVLPGDAEESLLLSVLRYDDDLKMPPKGKLSASIIKDFQDWIIMGAPDPRDTASERPKSSIDVEAGRKHWAFQPIADPVPPNPKNQTWSFDPIDKFILAKLEHSSLQPVADANRYTWLRRVSFDLTGLPPTREEIEAFVKDVSPQAFEKVVDRLLNSQAYGERWARHWLDLTGYADQIGTSNDVFAEHAWRYRDYLIAAFNSDKPFDQLTREQIAGDLLPHQSPKERAANIIATGFLVLGDVEIVNPDKLKLETDHIDQQISKVGTVFMGLTLGCVRCHDHKFDPIGLEDYYGIAGIFRSTHSTHKIPNGIWSGVNISELPETEKQIKERQELQSQHQQKQERLKKEQTQLHQEKTSIANQLTQPKADKAALAKRENEITQRLNQLAGEIEHARFFSPSTPKAFAVRDEAKPGDTRINIRGNPYAPGAAVARGMVRVVSWEKNPIMPQGQSGRVQLANWLTDKRHPLTARVTVNRIWQKLFGEGIVRSVDYFGTRGELPSHPELLDHLATRFMQNGWSQKQLIRVLVLTHAYRMSSEHHAEAAKRDPENRLLWRMNRQRLDAEALRDSWLAVSGQLLPSNGGPSMPLEYPENSSSLQPQAVNPPAFALKKFRPTQEFERTIYLPVIRSAQHTLAKLRDDFDFTQPAQIAGQRAQTVVPTQALFLLNNEMVRNRAHGLAADLLAKIPNSTTRLETLWLRVLNRPITIAEQDDAAAFLGKLGSISQDPKPSEIAIWTELCHALLTTNEFLYRL